MKHFTQEQLLAAAEAEQVPSDIQKHLDEGCMDCEFRLQTYTRILRSLRAGRPPEAPAAWTERAGQFLREKTAAASADPYTDPYTFLAEPVELGQMAAVRGRRPTSMRSVWRAGPFEIDLAYIEGGALVGQVHSLEAGRELPEDAACIVYPEGEPIVVPLEANGDFRISRPPGGPFSICIEGEDLRLLVEQTGLGESS